MPDNLTPRQKRAIVAIVAGQPMARAAAEAGVSRDTLYRWARRPDFSAAINQGTAEQVEMLSRRLVTLGSHALQALAEALTNPDTPQGVKVRAADSVLNRLLQLRELVDIETRLTKLEEAQNDTQSTH